MRSAWGCGLQDVRRIWASAALAALVALAAGCANEGGVAEPSGDGSELLGGIAVSASPADVSAWFVTIQVTLTNTTASAVERSYPAGCPVLIRLYREPDQVLVYDEGRRPCAVTTPIAFRLDAQESFVLTSGARYNPSVAGDSLPAGRYRAAALLRITGLNPIEIDAGSYRLAHCDEVTAICTYADAPQSP
jgi:hypothetical protein